MFSFSYVGRGTKNLDLIILNIMTEFRKRRRNKGNNKVERHFAYNILRNVCYLLEGVRISVCFSSYMW